MKHRWYVVLAVAVVITAAVAGVLLLRPASMPAPLRIILMIGDGMGTAHIAAARHSADPPLSLNIDNMKFGGLVTTHSANSVVTDSAAAATAMATGYKTDNGMIGVLPNGYRLVNIVERAESLGLSTGLVTTTRLTDATPAAFAAHVTSRNMEDVIADQMTTSDIDVLLGGGSMHFLPAGHPDSVRGDARNLAQEFIDQGYVYVDGRGDLLAARDSDSLLGLFTPSHMAYENSRNVSAEPSLSEMASVAIDMLNGDQDGFFLVIEGGRIDHAAHDNDLESVVGEMMAFDLAIGVAQNFTRSTDQTLVIVTADHETGGLTVLSPSQGGTLSVSWSTSGHTAVQVPIFSEGSQASRFSGFLDNDDIGERLFAILNLPRQVSPQQGVLSPDLILPTASQVVALTLHRFMD